MLTLFDFSPAIVAVIPVVLGIVQLFKVGGVPTRFAPLISLAVGIALIALLPSLSWQATIAQGLIAGLAASGLFSGSKATMNEVLKAPAVETKKEE